MTKKLLATLLVLGGMLSAGYFGVGAVMADDQNPHGVLVSRIADRFNLNEEDVEAVFTAVRDERQEEMKKQKEERLNQAVTDGVITENQKNTLLERMQEHQQERGQNREEMQNWFEEQGIDETKLRNYLGFDGRGEKGMGFKPAF